MAAVHLGGEQSSVPGRLLAGDAPGQEKVVPIRHGTSETRTRARRGSMLKVTIKLLGH